MLLNSREFKFLKNYRNLYGKSSAKREYHDESVFLKVNRALSKLITLSILDKKELNQFFKSRSSDIRPFVSGLYPTQKWNPKLIRTYLALVRSIKQGILSSSVCVYIVSEIKMKSEVGPHLSGINMESETRNYFWKWSNSDSNF